MKILIEVTHPAHVHFFRHAIGEFEKNGHVVAVTAREKEVTTQLLNNFHVPYTTLSKVGQSKLALFRELPVRDWRLLKFCRNFSPDILTGIGGVFAAHAGFLLRKPVIVFDDTEVAAFSHKLTYPFVKEIHCPSCYYKKLGKKQHFYPGYHELAYLHPKRFTADIEVVRGLGVNPAEKYAVVRFISWSAHHDVGKRGFPEDYKPVFIRELSKYAKVFITSEATLPDSLSEYQLKVPPHQIHHILSFASLCVSEGATIASECAVLGTPVIYVNPLQAGTISEQQKYGLLTQTMDFRRVLELGIKYLTNGNLAAACRAARQRMLSEKIDVTDYIFRTILNAVGKGE